MTTTLSTAARIEALGRCDALAGVPAAQLGVLAEIMDIESVGPGESLFEIDEPSDRVFVLVSGSLSVFVPRRTEAIRSLGPGALLGEYGMFAGEQRTASVRSHEGATLLSLEYDRFRSFLFQFPTVMFALLSTATQRLVEAERAAAIAGRASSSSD